MRWSGYLLAAAAERRAHPGDDIISELGAAEVDGDRLSDDELAMFLVQLLVAGNETTRNMMSGGLVAFAETAGSWTSLRAAVAASSPRALAPAVEEMLRWTTPVVAFMRTTTRPTQLAGVDLPEGAPILMLYASANRDESVFGPTARPLRSRPRPEPPRRLRVRPPLLHRGRPGQAGGSDTAGRARCALRLRRAGRAGGADSFAGHRRGPLGPARLPAQRGLRKALSGHRLR